MGGTKQTDGVVTLRRGETIYRADWSITGNRLVVYLGLDEEPAVLGSFEEAPQKLASMLLAELVDRHVAKEKRLQPTP